MSDYKESKTKELNAGPAASKTYVEMRLAETWKPIKANVQNIAEPLKAESKSLQRLLPQRSCLRLQSWYHKGPLKADG